MLTLKLTKGLQTTVFIRMTFNSAFKLFLNLKEDVMKEIASKLESKKLMTDSLKIFFFEEIRALDTSLNVIDDIPQLSTKQEEKPKKERKTKRPPTEHQQRVSRCMKLVRARYPDVRHQLCLGASQYMLTHLKENKCLDFSDESVVNQGIITGAMLMNEKRGECVFRISTDDNTKHTLTIGENEKKETTKRVVKTNEKTKPQSRKNTKAEDSESDSESSESESEPDCRLASQSESSDDDGDF